MSSLMFMQKSERRLIMHHFAQHEAWKHGVVLRNVPGKIDVLHSRNIQALGGPRLVKKFGHLSARMYIVVEVER